MHYGELGAFGALYAVTVMIVYTYIEKWVKALFAAPCPFTGEFSAFGGIRCSRGTLCIDRYHNVFLHN